MPTPVPPSAPSPAAEGDLAERAAALVNPASGLANDYLNVFNEIVMLIDLLPLMPNLADDIAAWSPVGYRDYFQRSPLAGSQGALRAYERLEPSFRAVFDRAAADLMARARRARDSALAEVARESEALGALCAAEAGGLRRKLDRLAQLVNGTSTRRRDPVQARVTALFDAA